MCSAKHREILEKKGISTYLDPRCTAALLGFSAPHIVQTLDAILTSQRAARTTLDCSLLRSDDLPRWSSNDLYVDFETIPEIINDPITDVVCKRHAYIFMIGVGFLSKRTGEWRYKSFTMKQLTLGEEARVMRQFMRFVMRHPRGRLHHWHNAEPKFWQDALARHPDLSFGNQFLDWFDIADLFRAVPLTIKGCLNFSLKNVARSMAKAGHIQTVWSDDGMSDGLECAARAFLMYSEGGGSENAMTEMNEIKTYNEVDCKVLFDILNYLRAAVGK